MFLNTEAPGSVQNTIGLPILAMKNIPIASNVSTLPKKRLHAFTQREDEGEKQKLCNPMVSDGLNNAIVWTWASYSTSLNFNSPPTWAYGFFHTTAEGAK